MLTRIWSPTSTGALAPCPELVLHAQGVLADVSIATGWATIALMVGGRFVFQYLGWGFAAAATPTVMLLTGGAFFALSVAAHLSPGALQLAAAGVTAGAVTQARH